MSNESTRKYIRNTNAKVPNLNEILRNFAEYNGGPDFDEDEADYLPQPATLKAVRIA